MSKHIELSPEALEAMKKQKTKSTVISLLISLVAIALLGTVLGLLTILIPQQEKEVIISYQAPAIEEDTTNEPKVRVQQRQVPTPPSAASAVANVITTTAPTSVSIPDTNQMTNVESPDFGSMDDFGMGFGFEEAMSATTSFFGSKVSGSRIAFVIDYSFSMRSKGRDALMRSELTSSIEKLEGGADYSLIFWAGPVWQAGDEIKDLRYPGVVSADGGKDYEWEFDQNKSHTFEPKGEVQKMQWTKPTSGNIKESLKQIAETPLVWGTEWKYPLQYALDMEPAPDIIVFMTDGSSGGQSLEIAKEYGKMAGRKGIVINTVALMEPKAEEGMKLLADLSGGSATNVLNSEEVQDMFTGEITKRDK